MYSAKTLAFTIGPFLLPKVISYSRTLRAKQSTAAIPIQPLPKPVSYSLNMLFVSALLALLTTLPHFNPENIFTLTSSRLQTPNDVLFTRLSTLRGTAGLTPSDEMLKPKLASLDSRLLYMTYGPDVVTRCPFCMSDDPSSYLYYALPSMMLPHILHLFLLGAATSTLVGGKGANKWRTFAAAVGVSLATVEVYMYAMYEWRTNARALRPDEYVHHYNRVRVAGGIMISIMDVVVSGIIYLGATNRMFVTPPTASERMESALRLLEQARGKVNALAIMRNAVVRDEGLRKRTDMYWMKEGKIMGEVMDEREVIEGVRSALTERVKVAKVEEEARMFAESMIPLSTLAQQPQEIANIG